MRDCVRRSGARVRVQRRYRDPAHRLVRGRHRLGQSALRGGRRGALSVGCASPDLVLADVVVRRHSADDDKRRCDEADREDRESDQDPALDAGRLATLTWPAVELLAAELRSQEEERPNRADAAGEAREGREPRRSNRNSCQPKPGDDDPDGGDREQDDTVEDAEHQERQPRRSGRRHDAGLSFAIRNAQITDADSVNGAKSGPKETTPIAPYVTATAITRGRNSSGPAWLMSASLMPNTIASGSAPTTVATKAMPTTSPALARRLLVPLPALPSNPPDATPANGVEAAIVSGMMRSVPVGTSQLQRTAVNGVNAKPIASPVVAPVRRLRAAASVIGTPPGARPAHTPSSFGRR